MKKYYDCFSINLMKHMKNQGFNPVRTTKHYRTQRTFWVFEKTEEFNKELLEWSKGRQQK